VLTKFKFILFYTKVENWSDFVLCNFADLVSCSNCNIITFKRHSSSSLIKKGKKRAIS